MKSAGNSNTVISHVRVMDSAIQTNADHCNGVADLAGRFASAFKMGDFGRILGLLHDKGKERTSFQNYIRHISGLEPGLWHGEDKQHAFIGAIIAKREYPPIYQLLSFPIAGHHGGLDDYINVNDKLRKSIPEEVSTNVQKFDLRIPECMLRNIPDRDTLRRDFHHIVRMLFSCLVDADYSDTEMFMQPDRSALRFRNNETPFPALNVRLEKYFKRLSHESEKTPLNDVRAKIQQRCRAMAKNPTGFYSLTVPTGGGKTLASLVWAINHGMQNSKSRVVIAIPYTSIVTQTAHILKTIFGEENVLEHHSNANFERIEDESLRKRMQFATENWDYPIIVTTNVQLLESMMGNKPSVCRKLHNLANSILIMDEVQTLPVENLQAIVDSLQTYQRLFGMSVLFTTASLPALKGDMRWGHGVNDELHGIKNIMEIVPGEWKLHEKLRRAKFSFIPGILSHDELAKRMLNHSKVLCIVNTRDDARKVYNTLKSGGKVLHLSRMMCSAHILDVIQKIKHMLKTPGNNEIRVISTQLIEAGVDIDFPVVFRQEAGLDSLLQSAGRCNREGRLDSGETFFQIRQKAAWLNKKSLRCDGKFA